MSRFFCNTCSFSTRHFPLLLKHYRVTHMFQYGFRISCGIDHCQKSFSVLNSFSRHIKRKHPAFYELNMSVRVCKHRLRQEIDDEQNHFELDTVEVENTVEEPEILTLDVEDHDYKRDIALFILTLREVKKLPLSACPNVVNEIQNIIQSCKQETSVRLNSLLHRNQIEPQELEGYNEIMNGFISLDNGCESLSTVYKQNTYFAKHFDFIEPIEIFLDKKSKNKKETLMYVPINQTLQALLKHEDVLSEVINGHQLENGLLGDFCDGNIFKNHPLFKEDPKSLQIQLYCDDFQVVNPLGTKIKKFKITAVYFVLGNLRPQQRSKLHTIQLALLCHSYLIKSFGWTAVLQPLLTDLQSLETNGLHVNVEGHQLVLRGTVSMLVTDNLAAHSLAGLTESFSALRNCRFCNITRENMQTQFEAANLTLRTQATYDVQVDLVKQDSDLVRVYGVKERSPFNTLTFFHVIGSMPSDIAHDVFEGFGSELMQIVIKTLVREGFFSLTDLNDKIRSFPYAESDKVNKPSTMHEEISKFRIKQTACQTWCLLRLLPLLIGSYVPEGHEYYSQLITFLDIVDLICAPVLTMGDAAYLVDLIEPFLANFFEICDDVSVKPKAHYLLHYAYEILQFGPLKHCWTLRFEGKHNYFKETANRTKNKVNICKTLATRHQYMQCLHYASDNFLGSDVTDTRKGKVFPIRLLHQDVQDLLNKVLCEQEVVYQVASATYEGTQYTSGGVVVIGYEEDTYQFGVIDCLFDLGGTLYVLLRNLETTGFSAHFHAYIVRELNTSSWNLLRPRSLFDSYPLGLYTVGGDKMVVLKYRVACKLP